MKLLSYNLPISQRAPRRLFNPTNTLLLGNRLSIFVLFILLMAQSAQANTTKVNEKSGKAAALEEESIIVVTATRTEKRLDDVPIPLEVITAKQIEQQNAKDLSEAITYAKGLLIQPIHGKTGDSIKMQGIDSDRILILVNGERVSASTGSTVDLSQIAVSDIQQIEIVKGASSALYGSSAMGGVINVITKTPDLGLHGSVSTSVGEIGDKQRADANNLDRYDTKADLSYRADNWWLFSNIDSRNSEGFEIEKNGRKIFGPDGYKNNYSVGLGTKPSANTSLQISQHAYRENHIIHKSIKIPGQMPLDHKEELSSDRTRLVSEWNFSEALDFKLQGFKERYENRTENTIKRKSHIEAQNIELQNSWKLSDFYTLTSGVNFNSESLEQASNGVSELLCKSKIKCEKDAKEVYFQADAFVTDSIEVLAGSRYQYDDSFGSHTSPKISAMFRKSQGDYQHSFRASIGDGYRVPNLKERYFIFDHSHLGYKVIGSADLIPEKIISYQFAYEISQKSTWLIETNLFYNKMTDLIQEHFKETLTTTDNSVAIYEYQNIAKSITYGLELSAYYQFTQIKINGNYQHLKSEDKSTGLELAKNPENLLKLGIERNLFSNRSTLLVQTQYQSDSYVDAENLLKSPSWKIWDIKFDYKINKQLKVFTGIDNITDEHRDPEIAMQDLRPVPGRIFYAGAKYQF